MTLHYVEVPTIMGPFAMPVSEPALLQMARPNAKTSEYAGYRIWRRLLDAKDEYRSEKSSITHTAIRASGKVYALSLALSDIYGMAPTFWEMEAASTLKLMKEAP